MLRASRVQIRVQRSNSLRPLPLTQEERPSRCEMTSLSVRADTAYLLLWQEAGRSSAGPVHWPLWPAPLPPFVGGAGDAKACPPAVKMPATTIAIAAARQIRFLMKNHPLPPFLRYTRRRRVGQCPSRNLEMTCGKRRGLQIWPRSAPSPARGCSCTTGSRTPPRHPEVTPDLARWRSAQQTEHQPLQRFEHRPTKVRAQYGQYGDGGDS